MPNLLIVFISLRAAGWFYTHVVCDFYNLTIPVPITYCLSETVNKMITSSQQMLRNNICLHSGDEDLTVIIARVHQEQRSERSDAIYDWARCLQHPNWAGGVGGSNKCETAVKLPHASALMSDPCCPQSVAYALCYVTYRMCIGDQMDQVKDGWVCYDKAFFLHLECIIFYSEIFGRFLSRKCHHTANSKKRLCLSLPETFSSLMIMRNIAVLAPCIETVLFR